MSVLLRRRREYRVPLEKAREMLQNVWREKIPEAMRALPEPQRVGDCVNLEWLAWRDAILERAMALGYVIGCVETVHTDLSHCWRIQATATLGIITVSYPVGGPVTRLGAVPNLGQAILMTRGYTMADERDQRNRPYIPVSHWFLHDPAAAQ